MSLSELSEKQTASVREAVARLNIYDGAVSSGKTVGSLVRWLQFVRQGPPGELLMVGKTERTLKRNVIDLLVDWLGPRRCKLVAGYGEMTLLGRRVYLAGANDERSEGKIRGLSLVGAYGDELTLWAEPFWAMLLSRLRRPGAKLFGTTNPDSPGHWLKRQYIDREGELDLKRFHFTLRDNPFLPEDYVASIESEFVGLWRKRYIEGLWVIAEGAIYDMWDPDRYVVDELPEMRRYWAALDYGTTNPFALLMFGLGVDGRVYVVGEWRWDCRTEGKQLTDADYLRESKAWIGEGERWRTWPEYTFVPPEEPGFRLEMFRDGWPGVREADNQVLEGVRLVAGMLSRDMLRIHRSCQGLIDEFPGYCWDPRAQILGLDQPIKLDDHSLDALRYGVLTSEAMWRGAANRAAA